MSFVGSQQKRAEDKKRQQREAEEAAAREEKERARIQQERTVVFMTRHWKVLLLASAALLVIVSIGAFLGARTPSDSSMAEMPQSAADLKGEYYSDVEAMLKKAGFTSVETTAIPDLVLGWVTKDGEVERVSANGETEFSAGSTYPKDAKILIAYHTFPEEKPTGNAEGDSAEGEAPESVAEEVDDTVLTPKNNPELAAVLKAENPGDPEVQAFTKKYAGRTIEFDGFTWDWVNSTSWSPLTGETATYDTLFDTNIYVGNVKNANKATRGPIFRVERFSMPNYSPAVNRTNVHVTARVVGYDADHEFFEISVVSLEDR